MVSAKPKASERKIKFRARDIRDRNVLLHFRFISAMGDINVVGQRGPTKHPKIEGHDPERHPVLLCQVLGRFQLVPVPLAVIDHQSVDVVPLVPGDGEDCRAVQTTDSNTTAGSENAISTV